MFQAKKGFTLIEMLVVIGIIGVLVAIVLFSVFNTTGKARDAKRKAEITQMGRLLSASCYVPVSGGGVYDLMEIIEDIKIHQPQYAEFIKEIPRDPLAGTDTESFYLYEVTAGGKQCVLYANLENEKEKVTLVELTGPTPGGGVGVLEADGEGWNGTRLYMQVSN